MQDLEQVALFIDPGAEIEMIILQDLGIGFDIQGAKDTGWWYQKGKLILSES